MRSIFSKYCYFCSGNELIEADHDQSEVIKAKVDEVSQMWTDLVNSSEVKGVKLQEACQQVSQSFITKFHYYMAII